MVLKEVGRMEIYTQFVGIQYPGGIEARIMAAVKVAVDRLGPHWAKLLTIDRVVITDLERPDAVEIFCGSTLSTVYFAGVSKTYAQKTNLRYHFIWSYLQMFLLKYPRFTQVIREHGREITFDLGTAPKGQEPLTPEHYFVIKYPVFLFLPGSLDPVIQEFFARCELSVMAGCLGEDFTP